MAFDKWENNLRCWPELDLNAYWHYKQKRHFLYVGVSNWFDLTGKKAHDQEQSVHWVFNPHLGHTLVRDKWNYNVEVKYLSPTTSRLPNVVEFRGIGNSGGVGMYISVSRKF